MLCEYVLNSVFDVGPGLLRSAKTILVVMVCCFLTWNWSYLNDVLAPFLILSIASMPVTLLHLLLSIGLDHVNFMFEL
jgi:hypothetical protein